MRKILNPVTDQAAPAASRPVLEAVRKAYGFVPNLLATFANSPTTLQGYTTLDGIWEKGTLTAVERQLVLLIASTEECATIAGFFTMGCGQGECPLPGHIAIGFCPLLRPRQQREAADQ